MATVDGNTAGCSYICGQKNWPSQGCSQDEAFYGFTELAMTEGFGIMLGNRSAMKLSAKFARQETEEARLARITRRRVPSDRVEAIRRMLSISALPSKPAHKTRRAAGHGGPLLCPDCDRAFALPMHLGRHRKAKHDE